MKNMQITIGRSGRVWPEVLRAVRICRGEGRRAVLYVPEQVTLQTERNLIADLELRGLLDIEVVSPKKLRELVRERAGSGNRKTLDEFGQAMAVHRAMSETAGELTYYRSMTEMPGAVQTVREALSELRESGITPEETEKCARESGSGATRAKLQDLNRIRAAYENLALEHFDDEKTAWTDMMRRLEQTEVLHGADLLVYGFDTVRPDLRELLCTAWALAENVRVFMVADGQNARDGMLFTEQQRSAAQLRTAIENAGGTLKTDRIDTPRAGCDAALAWLEENLFTEEMTPYTGETGDAVSLYAAAGREDEAEQTAACLLKWRGEGIPWDRMAVALPKSSGLEDALLSRLRLNGIPFYSAEKVPAESHGVCRMLSAALECISSGYTAELVAEAALSGFTVLEEEEALRLGNYAAAHGIEGARWRKPFERGEDAKEAEEARLRLIAPMERLRENLKKSTEASQSVEAVVRFLEEEGVWNRLQEREERLLREGMYREAVMDRQVWRLLMQLLDQMWTLLGKRRASIRDLKNMMECALGSASLSTLPEAENGVEVGEIGRLQAENVDALVLPGCQEGVFGAPEDGWLSDRERRELEQKTGREVGADRERRGWIRKYDLYRTLSTPGKRLRISWSLRDENGSPLQEDALAARVRMVFPDVREEGGVRQERKEFRPRTPLKAMESLGELLSAVREGREVPGAESAVVALLHSGVYGRTGRRMMEEADARRRGAALLPATARRLFHTQTASISRLEGFAACPYRHFIDYGLRPVRQDTFDFDAADAGSFFHSALDRYIRLAGQEDAWPDLPEERVDGMMDAICAELTTEWEDTPLREDALGIWQGEEYLRRIHHAARVLTRFAANSDFRTIATERSFGRGEGLPPLELRLRDGSTTALQGIIDRIDTYENGEGLWLRVVDYKSSGKKPVPAKMEDGEQLQLMIYLKAATAAYPGARPAGALFFPIQDAEVSAPEETPGAPDAERIKKVRMKGIVNAREDVMHAMDRDTRPFSADDIFNKDGTVKKSADWAVEEPVLRGLMDAAEQKAAEICEEIRTGRIEAAPRGKDEQDSPCRYCDYRTLCRSGRKNFRPRKDGVTCGEIAAEAKKTGR